MSGPTSAIEDLNQFLATEAGMLAYTEWLVHPVSAKVHAAARELSRPRIPRDPSECGLLLGECVGANNLLDFITCPTGRTADKMRGKMPPTRYRGSEQKETED